MTSEYKRLAYEASVFAAARLAMEAKYLHGDGSQKEELICELVPYGERIVPLDVISNIMGRLEATELQLRDEMAKYELRKRDESEPLPKQQPAQPQPQVRAPAQVPVAKPGRKARRT
jgi:hypothetical protein